MAINFNKEQSAALETRVDENVIIPAGAGSGKTKTLSEKVAKVLTGECGEAISPSQILVLTFTNNAAHEMKTRIIDRCKDLANIKDEIVSAHIQTFDSFSAYLVGKYSKELGIPDSINIASEAVMSAKLSTTLDELSKSYFKNEPDRYINTVRKLSLNNDEELKSVILDIYYKLDGFLEKERREFIDDYENRFLSKDFYNSIVDDIANKFKDKIKQAILQAYLVQEKYQDLLSESATIDSIKNVFEAGSVNETFFNKDYSTCSFYDKNNKDVFDALMALLALPSKEFINKCFYYMKNKVEKECLFGLSAKAFKGDKVSKAAYDVLSKIFKTQTSVCSDLTDAFTPDENGEVDFDKDYETVISFKDDIAFIFEMVETLSKKMYEYQKATNSYTFSMINKLSLKLITEHEDIANELREQFRFIMIDEYQDTNDIQECFVDVLTQPRKSDGGVASLFCVGDAKQAIYGFRNSNVALFNKRLNSGTMKIVPLTKNYRSGEVVLNEINYIFKHYMTLKHGGINYNKVGEAMEYDKEVNIYSEPYDHFGIKRIVSKGGEDDDGHNREIWECYAIINDIRNKMDDPNFEVSRRTSGGNKKSKAKLGDFCILMRVTKGYDLYQRIFAKEGINLNLKFSTDLTEVNAVVAIESLMYFIAYFLGIEECNDPKHYFASLARSYLFQYDDQRIFDLITDEECKPTDGVSDELKNDEIYKKVEEFTANHKDSSFRTIFLDLLKEFQIMEKLYLIGNIADNIAKIESLFTIVNSQEACGEGIYEFVKFLKNIFKYKINFSAETQIDVDDAVNVMTIHASKGLEQKIIYMPYSFNKIGDGRNKLPYTFSKKTGITLPNNGYTVVEHPEFEDKDVTISFNNPKTVLDYANKELYSTDQDDIDEHVRLFYVALTRAENSVYIVGDPKGSESSEGNKETLYGMLNYLPHYIEFSPKADEVIKRRVDPLFYSDLLDLIESTKVGPALIEEDGLGNATNYDSYLKSVDTYYEAYKAKKINDKLLTITDMLFASYYNQVFDAYNKKTLSVNYVASIYGQLIHSVDVDTLDELREEIKNNYNIDEDGEIEEDDTPVYSEEDNPSQKETPIKEIFLSSDEVILSDAAEEFLMNVFIKAFIDNKHKFFGLSASKTAIVDCNKRRKAIGNSSIPFELKELFLPVLGEVYDGVSCFYRTSYKTDEYKDEVSIFDISKYKANLNNSEPKINVDEIKTESEEEDVDISFGERIKKKASKILVEHDDDLQRVLDKGTRIHKYMELVDFKVKDTSFIPDPSERKLIDNVLTMDIFKTILSADKVYKEYPYYDEEFGTTGFIDLMYVKNGEYYIIDYKLKHVKDDGYQNQLATYQRNIKRLFNVDESKIHLNLLSIIDKELL